MENTPGNKKLCSTQGVSEKSRYQEVLKTPDRPMDTNPSNSEPFVKNLRMDRHI